MAAPHNVPARRRRKAAELLQPTIEILEAPRSARERRLDPDTEFTARSGAQLPPGLRVRLVEADPATVDPNTSRLFSRPEVRGALGISPGRGFPSERRGESAAVLSRRLAMLRLGGRVGMLSREEERGLQVFGQRRTTDRFGKPTRPQRPLTGPRFPFRELAGALRGSHFKAARAFREEELSKVASIL
jgi:hypothetical protein